MRRTSVFALCLACALAAASAGATIASAVEPIFEKVIIVPNKEGEKIPFTATGTKAVFTTTAGAKITCLTASASGNVVGEHTMTFAVTFKGCEGFTAKCTSAGALEGEVVTAGFEGKLGNLKSESTPGIALFGLKETDAEFTCGTTAVKLTGGVVGPISPFGSVVNKLTLQYKAASPGIQLFESLFGGPLDTFSLATGGGGPVHAALGEKIALKMSEPIEIT